jgi:MFS family permease
VTAALHRTFSSLEVPNYRRYFAGQVVSVSGNWMQQVAEMWLIVQLTGSGLWVGVTAGLQFLPVLLLGAWGGLIADRFPKRRLLMITQALMALPALTLWLLYEHGSIEVWMVFALVFARGTVNAFDNPARQSFVVELVGGARVVNAVSLNSVIVQSARITGPAVAAAVIATAGVGPCFLVNTLSFGAMLIALWRMDPAELLTTRPVARARGQLRSAVAHVRGTPALLIPLAMMALVGTLSFNFQVLLPLLARFTWHGGASVYAALTVAMGLGSVGGALISGARNRVTPRLLVGAAIGFGLAELTVAAAPVLPVQVVALALLGALSVTFSASANSALQLAVDPAMRGRVMALYSVVFLGSTPIGSPLVGWLAEVAGPRSGLILGAVAAMLAGLAARAAYARAGLSVAARPAEGILDPCPLPTACSPTRRSRLRSPRSQTATSTTSPR